MANIDIKQRILRRRQLARIKSTVAIKDKLLNLHKINDNLDQIMADLSLESEPDNDIGRAIQHLRAASDLLVTHGEKLLTSPMKGQYDDFEEGGAGFSSPSELLQQQMQARREESDAADNARIEAETDANYHARTGDTIVRDANGQFASFLRGNIRTITPEVERGYRLGRRSIWSKR